MKSSIFKNAVSVIGASAFAALIASSALGGMYPGEISQVKGGVTVQKAVDGAWYKAVDGLPVQLKDRIKTGKGSSCNLELDDGSLIFVAENTEASVEFIEVTQEKHTSTLGLWIGKLLSNIKKTPSTKMKVKCPNAVISVRGTEFAVEVSSQSSDVGVFEGEVAVSSGTDKSGEELDAEFSLLDSSSAPANIVSLKPDEQTVVQPGAAPAPAGRLSVTMQKNREKMNELRERVRQLREKLKRTKPEYQDKLRQAKLDRVMKLRENRKELKERINSGRGQLK